MRATGIPLLIIAIEKLPIFGTNSFCNAVLMAYVEA